MRRIALVLGLLLLLAGAGLGIWRWRTRLPSNTVVVRRGTITATVQATGTVQPRRQARLSLRTGGTVREIRVEEGDEVQAGEVLLRLDTAELERAVRQAELALEARRAELQDARLGPDASQVEIARANLRRATVQLQAAQAAYDEIADEPDAETSPEAVALENAKAAYEQAKAEFERLVEGPTPEEIARLENQVAAAEVALEDARARLAQAQLVAPFPGTVLEIAVREGENIGPGQFLILLADLHTLEIVAEIDEIDIGEVQPGQAVKIRLDAFPGEELTGTLVHVAPAASTERGAGTFLGRVQFAPTELPLKPGMGVSLEITTLEKQDVLLIPNRAVQTLGPRKIVKVWRNGRVEEVEVVTGLSNAEVTEIVKGLQEGDVVVVE